jgi:acyl-CoA reductase-like NAD-dependent aldehyde dehydrogenase
LTLTARLLFVAQENTFGPVLTSIVFEDETAASHVINAVA